MSWWKHLNTSKFSIACMIWFSSDSSHSLRRIVPGTRTYFGITFLQYFWCMEQIAESANERQNREGRAAYCRYVGKLRR